MKALQVHPVDVLYEAFCAMAGELGDGVIIRADVQDAFHMANHLGGVRPIIGTGKTKDIAHCRRQIARMLRDRGWSTPAIGWLIKKDHSAVIAMLKRKENAQ